MKRKTIEQLHADMERKEAQLIRIFRAWHTARCRLIAAGRRADKTWGAGEAHLDQLREAEVKPKVSINSVINSMMRGKVR